MNDRDIPKKPQTDLREKVINSLLAIKCCFEDLFEAVGIQNYNFVEVGEHEERIVKVVRDDNKESGIGSLYGSYVMLNGDRVQAKIELNMSVS